MHRNLKPDNIRLTRDGRPKILDFGLAKVQAAHAAAADATVTVRSLAGVVMGVPGNMSPEQVRGMATDHRSDILSFGVILYELQRLPTKVGVVKTAISESGPTPAIWPDLGRLSDQ